MKPFKTYTLLFLTLTLNCFLFSQQRITIEAGYRSLKDFIPERRANWYYSRKDSPVAGKGGYIQATIHLKRIFIPMQIGILRWNDNVEGVKYIDYNTNHHAPSWWGPIIHYREYLISYKSVSHYLHFSTGIGFNVLDAESKFHLGPIVRFNPQYLLSRREIANSVTEHYKHYENPPPPANPSGIPTDKETYSYASNAEDYIDFKTPYEYPLKNNILHTLYGSLGISSNGILFRSFGYSIEAGYQLQNFSRITFSGIQQKSSFYLQFGVVYQLWDQSVAK